MKIFFDKLWIGVKTYWQLFLLILGTIVGYLIFRKQEIAFGESVNKLLESHADQIKKINLIREDEKRQHEENEKRLKEALLAVQTQYDIAKKDLDERKKKEIEDIVKQYGDDPVELAKKLSSITGFSIIIPS